MDTDAASPWRVLSASTLRGDSVVNAENEKLGSIEELMIDLRSGRIACAVLSSGGFPGMGDKLFAIPWSAFNVDREEKKLVLNVKKETLEKAPGIDQDHWPDMADKVWGASIYRFYGSEPFRI